MRAGIRRLGCVVSIVAAALLMTSTGRPAVAGQPADLGLRNDGPWIAVRGEPLAVSFYRPTGEPLPTGTLYLGNDRQPGYTAVPLRTGTASGGGPGLVAQVPAGLVVGDRLRYYAVFRDPATGATAVFPAGGARSPRLVWVSAAPVAVPLGVHRFGRLTPAQAVVARAGPKDVGFYHGHENAYGPWSFALTSDGMVWLLDEVNYRVLGWRAGGPNRPVRTVPLPASLLPADFAVGPDGTVYVSYPDRATRAMALCALTPAGVVRWRAPLATTLFNVPLRWGPDGRLYVVDAVKNWMPVVSGGKPLPVAEQTRQARLHRPLPDAGQLVTSWMSRHEVRYAVIDGAGRLVRAWRVTSTSDIDPTMSAVSALSGADPVVAMEVRQGSGPGRLMDYQVLRLSPAGAAAQVTLRSSVYFVGDTAPLPELRVGPDGALYQLRTSPTEGVSIVRYRLASTSPPTSATPTAPAAPSAAAPIPPVSGSQSGTPATSAPARAPTSVPAPARQGSRSWIPWALGFGGLAIAITIASLAAAHHRRAPATDGHRRRPEPTGVH